MKKFIEKLIGRLEELYDRNDKTKKMAYEEQDWEKFDLFTHRCEGIYSAISIVNQLAEEYKSGTLCYLGSPCEYQNKDIRVDDNKGWIPCSERLPEIGERVLLWVYGRVHIGERTKARLFEEYEIFSLENRTSESRKRIEAWQPLPPEYQPKGE